ncbi:MAG TPA: FecR domain-containing protein [Polyangiaceae bacterium]|nr:FecR domain-containing protein [Polyangiaceae bacterium]
MSATNLQGALKARLNEPRLARQWARIATRLDAPRMRLRWPVLALGLALVGAVAALLWVRGGASESATAWDGAVLETEGAGSAVLLGDGSRIELYSQTKLSVHTSDGETRLTLQRGGASFDVTHAEGRSFRVSLGSVDVKVVGTRFSVREVQLPSGARHVEVAVARGLVEASSGASVARLGPGQSWSVPFKAVESTTVAMKPPPAPAAALSPSAAPPAPEREEPAAAGSAAPASPRSQDTPAPPSADAKQLFETANRARAAGNASGAAEGYRALLDQYPRDPRAALAAFELGRLQMDRLGQPAQAISSLRRAVASSSGGGFREDAMARLVTAHAATGARAACLRARGAYLKQYPNGVHRTTVQAQCGASGLP